MNFPLYINTTGKKIINISNNIGWVISNGLTTRSRFNAAINAVLMGLTKEKQNLYNLSFHVLPHPKISQSLCCIIENYLT